MLLFIISELMMFFVTPKGDHRLSQRYSELYLNTLFKPLRWLSKKCRRQDLNSQPQRPLSDLIPSLMLQTARFYTRLYYHAQTRAHNLLRQKVITDWVSAIVSYILTFFKFFKYLSELCQGNILMSKDWSRYKTRDKEERKLAVLRRINSKSLASSLKS